MEGRLLESLYKKSNYLIGHGKSCGTFGELLQGILPGGRRFLVTFPIQLYSQAYFYYDQDQKDLTVEPAHKKKSLIFAKHLLNSLGVRLTGHIKIISDIPVGKGLASSSADLIATMYAIQNCFGHQFTRQQIESFLTLIEPSDAVFYPGIVSYYQEEAILRSYLGVIPELSVLGVDEGGTIDTNEFKKNYSLINNAEKYEYEKLLIAIENAIRKRDLSSIGKIATTSVIMNQKLREHKYLNEILKINDAIQGLGIILAHSGTYIGILLNNTLPDFNLKIAEAKRLLGRNCEIWHSINACEP